MIRIIDSIKGLLQTSSLNNIEVKKVYKEIYKYSFNDNGVFKPTTIIKDISIFHLGEELYKDQSRSNNIEEFRRYIVSKI